jgi:putative PIN family toxin of toxin-antitoxin system
MSYARKRVVFDTSSLIPACLNPDREPAKIFRRAVLEHDVFCSADTFNELATVLAREKFNAWRPLEHRLMWVRLFRESVILIEVTTPVTECRDPKDNKFFELAISAKADVLVSSDVHLLEMHPFRGVQILQLADFKQQILWEAVTERADRLT